MVKPIKENRMRTAGYTRQQRQLLQEQFNQVLNKCQDQQFGRALSAAAKAIQKAEKTRCI